MSSHIFSVCIPHLFEEVNDMYISEAFNVVGNVCHIERFSKQNNKGDNYNSIYIYFDTIHNTEYANRFYNKVVNSNPDITATFYHNDDEDECKFWIVLNGLNTITDEIMETYVKKVKQHEINLKKL